MTVNNVLEVSELNRQQGGAGANAISRCSPYDVLLQAARLIVPLFLLTILGMDPGAAQNVPATDTSAPASSSLGLGNIYYLGTFTSAKDLDPPSGICGAFGLVGRPPVRLPEARSKAIASHCDTVVEAVAGRSDFGPDDELRLPAKITGDSRNRVIVVDRDVPPSIHIFDFDARKHLRIAGGRGKKLQSPAGVAIDAHGRLYVTDEKLRSVLVYNSNGRFLRYLGKDEPRFQRPSGIAVDPISGHIFVADPPRNVVLTLDTEGNLLARLGTSTGRGGPAEFAAPTEVIVRDQKLFVLDSQNYRIQVFDLAGHFESSIHPESMEPSQGFAIDGGGRIYLDGPEDTIRILQPDGRLLLQIGGTGTGHGEFRRPGGIWIDGLDRIFVADTANHRVQSFEWGIEHVAKLPHPQ